MEHQLQEHRLVPRLQQDQDLAPTVSHRDLSLVMSPVVRHSTAGRIGPEIRLLPSAVPPAEVWVELTLRDSDRRHALPFFRSCRRASLNGELFVVLQFLFIWFFLGTFFCFVFVHLFFNFFKALMM